LLDEGPPAKTADARKEAAALGVPFLERLQDAPAWDVLVLSPGIPPTHPVVRGAVESGRPVRAEIEIGFLACPAPILAVTGTNGKTTVTHLVTHLFQESGRPAVMAGNVGRALCDAVLDPRLSQAGALVVCEVSSFQLETIERFHPRAACILNVTPDHLDRYPSIREYAEAKYRVTENQEAGDALVLNGSDPLCRAAAARTRAAVWEFDAARAVGRGAFLRDERLYLVVGAGGAPVEVMAASEIPLPGLHNVENVLAALCMGAALGLDAAAMAQAVRSFRAVPHRIEFVAEINGARYYNDSKATNLDSVEKALLSFEEPIILIAGGRDKGAPWTVLNNLVARKVKGLVLIGEAAPIGRAAWGGLVPRVEDAPDMASAVAQARAMSDPGDVVLLSPGCASYDMYRNFEARGDDFRGLVRRMAGDPTPAERNA
jgi:UDP-N-acetylmuramoylalanine--D-glutamate ligase